jgi:hypothetical protein
MSLIDQYLRRSQEIIGSRTESEERYDVEGVQVQVDDGARSARLSWIHASSLRIHQNTRSKRARSPECRLRTLSLRTAIPTARRVPTTTTKPLARVMAV